MKYPILFKKTSTIRSSGKGNKADGGKLHDYIESYLDETRKNTPSTPSTTGFKMVKPDVKLVKGVGYLAKEKKGDIKVCGFLREMVYAQSGKRPEDLSNAEKAHSVEAMWNARLRAKGLTKIGHKVVISIHPDLCDLMLAKRMPVDELLYGVINTTMERYQQKYYPGQTLGYLTGIHHDKTHIHGHILLYPQTDAGKALNVSHWSKVKLPDGSIGRVDYQGFIKETIERLGLELERKVKAAPEVTPFPFPEDYKIQGRLLTKAALECVTEERKRQGIQPGKQIWNQIALRRQQMEALSHDELRPILARQYQERSEQFVKRDKIQAQKFIDDGKVHQEKIGRRLRAIASGNCALASTWLERGNFSRDIFKAKRMLLGWKTVKWGSHFFRDDPDGRWWEKRSRTDDTLGRLMKRTKSDLESKFSELDSSGKLLGKRYVGMAKRDHIHRQISQLTKLHRIRSEETAGEITRIRRIKQDDLQLLTELRLKEQIRSQYVEDAKSILADEVPRYLKKYELWKNSGEPIPITIARTDFMVSDEARLANRRALLERAQPITPNALAVSQISDDEEVEQEFVDVTAHTGSASLLPIIGKKGSPKDLLTEPIDVPLRPHALKELGLETDPSL